MAPNLGLLSQDTQILVRKGRKVKKKLENNQNRNNKKNEKNQPGSSVGNQF